MLKTYSTLRTAKEHDAVLRVPILAGLAGEEARVAGPPLGVRPDYCWAGRQGACPARRCAGHDDETREDAKSCGAKLAARLAIQLQRGTYFTLSAANS